MPLERIVTKLTKKYLLKYLENIEPNQLKLGILKGSLELKDLKLTKSALDEFYVPVKIKEGHIGNISLQIPWTKLDTQPTSILVEQLYVLLVPNTDIKFNNERTEKSREKSKHKKLLQIENAKKGQVEKLTLCSYLLGKLKKKGKQKLIKAFRNVKIQVNDINIRYEDTFADSEHPLAIGISLKKFTLTTTDENWVPCSVEKEVNEFCKVMELTCLSVFLDCNSKQFVASEKKSLVDCMQEDLFKTYEEANHNFLIWRSSPRANLKLNINPELNNYSLPLVCLKVVFNEFGLEISKVQYNGMLKLLESCERIYLENLLKEYCNPRPCCTLSEKCKEKDKYLLDAYKKREWRLEKDLFSIRRLSNNTSFNHYKMESGINRWKMAQKCVLEEYIRRYRWPFTWNCIQYHRRVMKRYLIAYIKTLYLPKFILLNIAQREIKACERYLDVFSITLIRSQANILVARLRNKSAQKSEKSTEGPPMLSDEKMEKIFRLKQEFSRQEKMKLYEDIGYLENEREAAFPREFVAVSVSTEISTLSLTLKDETQIEPKISKLLLKDMCANASLRPADKDFQVKGTIGDLTLLGSPLDTIFQKIVESYKDEEEAVVNHLLDFNIEKHSLEGECDIKLNVASRSLQFVHDANYKKKISDFLRPQNEENLKELSKRVMPSFKRMKEQYESRFKHADKQHKEFEFDISVDLEPSYFIIPTDKNNKFGMDSIAISLGKVKINTKTAKNKDIECPSSQTELPWHGRLKYLTVSPYDDIKSICPWCFDDKTYKLVTNLRSHAKRHLSINSSKNATSKHLPDILKRFELTATTDEDMTHEPQMERGEKCPTDNSENMKSSSSSSTTDEKWLFKPHVDRRKKNEQDDLQNMKSSSFTTDPNWSYVPHMYSSTKNQPDAKRQPDILKKFELTATTDEDLTHEPQMERGEKCPTDNSEKMKSSSSSSTTDEKWLFKPHMDSGKKNEQDDLQNMKWNENWAYVPRMYSRTKNQPDAKRQPDIFKRFELTATTDEDLTHEPQMERGEKCQTDNSEKMKSSLSSSTTDAKWFYVPHLNSRYRQDSREKMKSTSFTTGANLILLKQAKDSRKKHHLKDMEKMKSISSTTGAGSYSLLKQMDTRKNYHLGNRETTKSTASPKKENTSIGPEIERRTKYQPDKRESIKAKSSIVGPYKQQIETGHFEIEEVNTNTIIVSTGSKLYRIRLVKMDLAIAMTKTRAASMKCVMHRRKKTFIKKTILVTSEATKVALAKVIEMNTRDILMIEASVED